MENLLYDNCVFCKGALKIIACKRLFFGRLSGWLGFQYPDTDKPHSCRRERGGLAGPLWPCSPILRCGPIACPVEGSMATQDSQPLNAVETLPEVDPTQPGGPGEAGGRA